MSDMLEYRVSYASTEHKDGGEDRATATVEMELEANKTVRQIVPEILAALVEAEGVPKPAIIDAGQPDGDHFPYTVSFDDRQVLGADLDKLLGDFGHPEKTVLRIEPGGAIVGRA